MEGRSRSDGSFHSISCCILPLVCVGALLQAVVLAGVGFVKGALVLVPVALFTVTTWLMATILHWPRAVLATYVTVAVTQRLGPNLRFLALVVLPGPLIAWPLATVIGSLMFSLVVGFLWPLWGTVTLGSLLEGLKLFTAAVLEPLELAETCAMRVWKFNHTQYFTYLDDVRRPYYGEPLDVSLLRLFISVVLSLLCSLLSSVAIMVLGVLRLPFIIARALGEWMGLLGKCPPKLVCLWLPLWMLGIPTIPVMALSMFLLVVMGNAIYLGPTCGVVAYLSTSSRPAYRSFTWALWTALDLMYTHIYSMDEAAVRMTGLGTSGLLPAPSHRLDGQRVPYARAAQPPTSHAAPSAAAVTPLDQAWSTFEDICAVSVERALCWGWVPRSDLADTEAYLFIGLPALALLHLLADAATVPPGWMPGSNSSDGCGGDGAKAAAAEPEGKNEDAAAAAGLGEAAARPGCRASCDRRKGSSAGGGGGDGGGRMSLCGGIVEEEAQGSATVGGRLHPGVALGEEGPGTGSVLVHGSVAECGDDEEPAGGSVIIHHRSDSEGGPASDDGEEAAAREEEEAEELEAARPGGTSGEQQQLQQIQHLEQQQKQQQKRLHQEQQQGQWDGPRGPGSSVGVLCREGAVLERCGCCCPAAAATGAVTAAATTGSCRRCSGSCCEASGSRQPRVCMTVATRTEKAAATGQAAAAGPAAAATEAGQPGTASGGSVGGATACAAPPLRPASAPGAPPIASPAAEADTGTAGDGVPEAAAAAAQSDAAAPSAAAAAATAPAAAAAAEAVAVLLGAEPLDPAVAHLLLEELAEHVLSNDIGFTSAANPVRLYRSLAALQAGLAPGDALHGLPHRAAGRPPPQRARAHHHRRTRARTPPAPAAPAGTASPAFGRASHPASPGAGHYKVHTASGAASAGPHHSRRQSRWSLNGAASAADGGGGGGHLRPGSGSNLSQVGPSQVRPDSAAGAIRLFAIFSRETAGSGATAPTHTAAAAVGGSSAPSSPQMTVVVRAGEPQSGPLDAPLSATGDALGAVAAAAVAAVAAAGEPMAMPSEGTLVLPQRRNHRRRQASLGGGVDGGDGAAREGPAATGRMVPAAAGDGRHSDGGAFMGAAPAALHAAVEVAGAVGGGAGSAASGGGTATAAAASGAASARCGPATAASNPGPVTVPDAAAGATAASNPALEMPPVDAARTPVLGSPALHDRGGGAGGPTADDAAISDPSAPQAPSPRPQTAGLPPLPPIAVSAGATGSGAAPPPAVAQHPHPHPPVHRWPFGKGHRRTRSQPVGVPAAGGGGGGAGGLLIPPSPRSVPGGGDAAVLRLTTAGARGATATGAASTASWNRVSAEYTGAAAAEIQIGGGDVGPAAAVAADQAAAATAAAATAGVLLVSPQRLAQLHAFTAAVQSVATALSKKQRMKEIMGRLLVKYGTAASICEDGDAVAPASVAPAVAAATGVSGEMRRSGDAGGAATPPSPSPPTLTPAPTQAPPAAAA